MGLTAACGFLLAHALTHRHAQGSWGHPANRTDQDANPASSPPCRTWGGDGAGEQGGVHSRTHRARSPARTSEGTEIWAPWAPCLRLSWLPLSLASLSRRTRRDGQKSGRFPVGDLETRARSAPSHPGSLGVTKHFCCLVPTSAPKGVVKWPRWQWECERTSGLPDALQVPDKIVDGEMRECM